MSTSASSLLALLQRLLKAKKSLTLCGVGNPTNWQYYFQHFVGPPLDRIMAQRLFLKYFMILKNTLGVILDRSSIQNLSTSCLSFVLMDSPLQFKPQVFNGVQVRRRRWPLKNIERVVN